MSHIFMDVILLGMNDAFEVAGRIKIKTKRPQDNIGIGDIGIIKQEQKNQERFLLEEIFFFFGFFHRCLPKVMNIIYIYLSKKKRTKKTIKIWLFIIFSCCRHIFSCIVNNSNYSSHACLRIKDCLHARKLLTLLQLNIK